MYFKKSQISLVVFIIVLVSIQLSYAGLDQFDIRNSTVDVQKFMSGGPSKDGIPSLDDPQFILAHEVDFLRDDDEVIGVVIDGEAKAYPIRILNWHEIVNDQVSSQKVAVTWCPLTHSAVAFNRDIDGRTLEFGVSGLLYNSNVVIYDRQSNGLWSQLGMGGLTGKFSEKRLEAIPLQVDTWKGWREKYPGTRVLSQKTGHQRNYDRDPYADYHSSKNVMFPTGSFDNRLDAKSLVVGVRVKNAAKAYPLKNLLRLNKPLEDQIGDTSIQIRALRGGAIEVTDIDGNVLSSVVAYWFAWSTFNRNTLVYN